MVKKVEVKKGPVTTSEQLENKLKKVKLKDVKVGEKGELVKLVSIENTKSLLIDMASKYKKININIDNYKKEGADAEKELRQSRYLLQNIFKSNNDILNSAKKDIKELYDSLIDIIKPVEDKLKSRISEIEAKVKAEKEEQERKEKERIEKIKIRINNCELAFERAVLIGKTNEDLVEFDNMLNQLKEEFEEFGEFKFSAERIHAIYTGRRKEIVNAIDEVAKIEQAEKERKEKELKEKQAAEEKQNKIFEYRKSILTAMELSHDEDNSQFVGVVCLSYDEIKSFDEIDWFDTLENIKELKKIKEESLNSSNGSSTGSDPEEKKCEKKVEEVAVVPGKSNKIEPAVIISVEEEIKPFKEMFNNVVSLIKDDVIEKVWVNENSGEKINTLIKEIEESINKCFEVNL